MGFEYGYSIANGDALVCWEAQFGDFVNGGQVIVDQFVAAAEDKWKQQSGLVLLLPHGFEGQGPEHSSARLERFLTLAAEDNIQIAQPTTAAQYFHLLRRQMLRSVRKPLIVMTPKSLLRAKASASAAADFESGHFRETIDDAAIDPSGRDAIRRVVLCTGKFAYPLLAERDQGKAPVAVVRVEQLYPFPYEQLMDILSSYPNAREIVWAQEEPANMGAWPFIHFRLVEHLSEDRALSVVARHESGSPATGTMKIHQQESEDLVTAALKV
jgi:2-oxoglutarate dehydrogenase complex dehydrogenase (E1) component-like enzyme